MPYHVPDRVPLADAPASSKWSRTFWSDLAERVGSTLIYQVITLITLTNTELDARIVWTIVGLPTVLAVLKGIGANLADPESGPSLLPAPPAPEVQPDDGEGGFGYWPMLLVVVLCLVIFLFAVRG